LLSVAIGIREDKSRADKVNPGTHGYVTTVRGVEFINDSKATMLTQPGYALESMQKPVILILGGVDKGNDYSLMRDLVIEK